MNISESIYVGMSGRKTGKTILSNIDSFRQPSKLVTIEYKNAPGNFPNKGELEWLMEEILNDPEKTIYEFPIGVVVNTKPYDNETNGVWLLAEYINYLLRGKG